MYDVGLLNKCRGRQNQNSKNKISATDSSTDLVLVSHLGLLIEKRILPYFTTSTHLPFCIAFIDELYMASQ